jgi:uncharacterized phage protein gp47/JayE
MALVSNVPQIQFTENGLIIPTADQVLTGVLQDFNTAFGGGLSLNLTTPQGQLATSLAAIITAKNNEIAYITNQVDPQYSAGFFQDAIGNIYFITRKPGTSTQVVCVIVGLENTVIPVNTLAKDTVGNVYAFILPVIIPASGTTLATLENIVPGKIACAPNTLTVIFQSVIGWDSINNPAAGIPGTFVETRAQFEFRRQQSVAVNALGTVGAIRGAVFEIINIQDVYVVDNPTGAPIMIGTVTLVAHSVFVCAYAIQWTAALELQVATAIWLKKDLGCDYNGDTTVTVYDGVYPYEVTFQEAAELQIYFTVNITNSAALPNNIVQLIQNAIFQSFDEKIGALIYASSYYGAILGVDSTIQIQSVFVGAAANPVTISYQTQITEKPLTDPTNIIVNLV